MSEAQDTVKESDAVLGKKIYFCLFLIQEASGLVPDLDSSRQPNTGSRGSGEVDNA